MRIVVYIKKYVKILYYYSNPTCTVLFSDSLVLRDYKLTTLIFENVASVVNETWHMYKTIYYDIWTRTLGKTLVQDDFSR